MANFHYTSNFPAAAFDNVQPVNASAVTKYDILNSASVSSLRLATLENRAKYNYTKFAIVNNVTRPNATAKKAFDAEFDKAIRDYWQGFVFPVNQFPPEWTADVFHDRAELWEIVKTMDKQPYCCALTFNKFDNVTDDYEVEFSVTKPNIPDTNRVAYNPLVRKPDLFSWDLWMKKGTVGFYPAITEFIARWKAGGEMGNIMPTFL